MQIETSVSANALSTLSPNVADSINRNVVQSEIEGGVYLPDLAPGTAVEIETANHTYKLVNCGYGVAMLSGHPRYCPQPVCVRIQGSTWGGSLLKQGFIGRSMHMEFRHPKFRGPITTSRIRDIRPIA